MHNDLLQSRQVWIGSKQIFSELSATIKTPYLQDPCMTKTLICTSEGAHMCISFYSWVNRVS